MKLEYREWKLLSDILECWEWNNEQSYLDDIEYNKFLDKLYKILEM